MTDYATVRDGQELRELDKAIFIVLGGDLDADPPHYSTDQAAHNQLATIIENYALVGTVFQGTRFDIPCLCCFLTGKSMALWSDGRMGSQHKYYGYGATMLEAFADAAAHALPMAVHCWGFPAVSNVDPLSPVWK